MVLVKFDKTKEELKPGKQSAAQTLSDDDLMDVVGGAVDGGAIFPACAFGDVDDSRVDVWVFAVDGKKVSCFPTKQKALTFASRLRVPVTEYNSSSHYSRILNARR